MVTWEQKHLSVVICVYCIMSSSEIFLSHDELHQKKKKCKPWWQPLANTSLISQFQENISSFNFLANTLKNELPIEFNLESFRFGNCNHNHHTMFNH